MATTFPAVAVSLVYILYDACRRARKRPAAPAPPPAPAAPPRGDRPVERRLDCLTVLANPNPGRRR
jgi:hypothetical protein